MAERREVFGVNMRILKDAEQRACLKEYMLEIQAKKRKLRVFDVIQSFSFERNERYFSSPARPGKLGSNPLDWPEEYFNRYVAVMMEATDEVIFFNSVETLLNLIEHINMLEEKV